MAAAMAVRRARVSASMRVKDWITGEGRSLHIGNHGGTHEDEMMIPLIVEEA